MPKADEVSFADDDDDSSTIDVSVEGDAIAAEMAKREIEAIVDERTSVINVRLKEVPAEFYPFIAGAHSTGIEKLQNGRDIKVKIPAYYAWSHQPPPQALSSGSPPAFLPHPNSHIQLSGERRAVREARAEIERQVEALRRQITLSQLDINRGQHQFIIGENGASLNDFLAETGCAVILPPDSDESGMLTITGPYDQIEAGREKAINIAGDMHSAIIDIARQHSKAPMGAQVHARALAKYLQQRQAIAQLEKLHDSRIVLPTSDDGPASWEMYSRDGKNIIRARSDIMNVVNAYPPARLRHIEMDPFYHEHLRDRYLQTLRNDYGVHMLVPDEMDRNSPVILVYEGPVSEGSQSELPRQRPSESDIIQFEQALEQAQNHILNLMTGHPDIMVRDVDVPPK